LDKNRGHLDGVGPGVGVRRRACPSQPGASFLLVDSPSTLCCARQTGPPYFRGRGGGGGPHRSRSVTTYAS